MHSTGNCPRSGKKDDGGGWVSPLQMSSIKPGRRPHRMAAVACRSLSTSNHGRWPSCNGRRRRVATTHSSVMNALSAARTSLAHWRNPHRSVCVREPTRPHDPARARPPSPCGTRVRPRTENNREESSHGTARRIAATICSLCARERENECRRMNFRNFCAAAPNLSRIDARSLRPGKAPPRNAMPNTRLVPAQGPSEHPCLQDNALSCIPVCQPSSPPTLLRSRRCLSGRHRTD